MPHAWLTYKQYLICSTSTHEELVDARPERSDIAAAGRRAPLRRGREERMSEKAARDLTFRAVADPTRRAILDVLSHAPSSVSDLCARFDVSQPAISQHLAVLRDAGLVSVTPDGKRRLYALEAAPLAQVHAWAAHYERFWTAHLDRLGHVLAKAAAKENETKRRKKR